jgi:chorismate lyase / 3-hydroxybenzoate synthase
MAVQAGLHVEYAPLAGSTPAWWEGVLGIVRFDGLPALPPQIHSAAIPLADIGTPVLAATGEVCEIWRTHRPVTSGDHGRLRYRRGENVLFGCISIAETEAVARSGFGAPDASTSSLMLATQQAYREIFAALDALAYPYLLKISNYLPQINLDTQGVERYRQFNRARRETLAACGRDMTGNVPAACALGSSAGSPLVIYFLASRDAPILVENPRQVSAYDYPPQYGPKPAFSRASVLAEKSGATLFISGTASIVGHQTMHPGDVTAQTRETLANISALLDEARRVPGAPQFELQTLAYKVYVRNAADLPLVRSQLHAALGAGAQVLYLRADICRHDLLVEIEATGRHTVGVRA